MKKLFALLLYFVSQHVVAADCRSGNTVIINHPINEDLYISAGTVIINAPIYGDLIVAGGNVTVNDTIRDDVLLLGGSISINGYIGDDIRCAGGSINITAYVEGDILITGGNITIEKKANISSLSVAGGEVIVNGTVRNNIKSRSGSFELNGIIIGDVDLRGDKLSLNGKINGKSVLAATKPIIVGHSAHFGRSIRYWQPFKRQLKLDASVASYQPIYDPLLSITHSKWYFLGASTFLGLLWYLGMAYIMILIIQYLFHSILAKAGKTFYTNTMQSAVYGIAVFVGTPVVIIICLATVIGVPVSAILAVGYILLILLATIISSLVVVNWVNVINTGNWNYWQITGTALFTFILLKIVFITPFLGWLVMIIIVSISYGAIISNVRLNFRRLNKTSQFEIKH